MKRRKFQNLEKAPVCICATGDFTFFQNSLERFY